MDRRMDPLPIAKEMQESKWQALYPSENYVKFWTSYGTQCLRHLLRVVRKTRPPLAMEEGAGYAGYKLANTLQWSDGRIDVYLYIAPNRAEMAVRTFDIPGNSVWTPDAEAMVDMFKGHAQCFAFFTGKSIIILPRNLLREVCVEENFNGAVDVSQLYHTNKNQQLLHYGLLEQHCPFYCLEVLSGPSSAPQAIYYFSDCVDLQRFVEDCIQHPQHRSQIIESYANCMVHGHGEETAASSILPSCTSNVTWRVTPPVGECYVIDMMGDDDDDIVAPPSPCLLPLGTRVRWTGLWHQVVEDRSFFTTGGSVCVDCIEDYIITHEDMQDKLMEI